MNRPAFLRNILLLTLVAAFAMTGCTDYKVLDVIEEPKYCTTKIHFDWGGVDSIPKQMRVGLYPVQDNGSNGSYSWLDVGNRDTTLLAPEGTWRMTAWNNDPTHVVYDQYGRCDSLNVTSTDPFTNFNSRFLEQILDSIFPNHVIKDYPDYMVHDNKDVVNIAQNKENVITVKPDSMVTTVNITARGIKGLDMVKMTKGALSNVAGKRYIAHPNKTTQRVTVLFDADPHPNDDTVTATFWVFALEPEQEKNIQHHAALFFWTTQGQAFVKLDVTDLVHNAMKQGTDINLELNLDVDIKELFNYDGFDVDIDEWNKVDIPVGV